MPGNPLETLRVEIVQLLASPLHRYEGRPADGPLPYDGAEPELRDTIELRAGLGIVGDRHFGHVAHRQASVTIQAAEALDAMATDLSTPGHEIPAPGLAQTRRNILLRGVDVDALVGRDVILDSGDGPIRLHAHRRANPCGWMNIVVAPGAHRALRYRGGLRMEPLTDGTLRVGPAVLHVSDLPITDLHTSDPAP